MVNERVTDCIPTFMICVFKWLVYVCVSLLCYDVGVSCICVVPLVGVFVCVVGKRFVLL